MKYFLIVLWGVALLQIDCISAAANPAQPATARATIPMRFVSFIGYQDQAKECLILCESIRTFAGSLKKAPIRVYYADFLTDSLEKYQGKFSELSIELRPSKLPQEAFQYALGMKPFIAAQAEADAELNTELLVFLDPNIMVIKEPKDFILPEGKCFAYRPVMHQNIGSLYAEPPDPFWSRLYQLLNVVKDSIFPMEAIADKKMLRPYFNAGLLVLRPERRILRNWADYFQILFRDSVIAKMSTTGRYNIFLHQAALVGAVLNHVKRVEMVSLPFSYNCPLFFEKFYGSELQFDSIEDIVTLKCEFSFEQLPSGWDQKLKGPAAVIAWIKARHAKSN